ncbi:Fic family protein [Candidatus Gracilibacteria bacterium]|nr:Fic family protein [Candidatus Gracilibacteria bacterium]
MKILRDKYLDEYNKKVIDINKKINNFLLFSKDFNFDYLIEASSVYSSNIEGNTINLNSFMNYKIQEKKIKTKDIEEIENLIKAYNFAGDNLLNQENFLKAHYIASKTLLINSKRGVYRGDKVGVFGKNGLIYMAIEPELVKENMQNLFDDINFLLNSKLSNQEIFYYASFIHLTFVHIHPFADGNGRCARLLEKWFIVSKLGKDFWKLQSEKFYKENREKYYENINLGVNYYELNYDNSLNFLYMLKESLDN